MLDSYKPSASEWLTVVGVVDGGRYCEDRIAAELHTVTPSTSSGLLLSHSWCWPGDIPTMLGMRSSAFLISISF